MSVNKIKTFLCIFVIYIAIYTFLLNCVLLQVDYEDTCNEKIPLWKSWANSGRVQEAIDQLLALEKQTRTVKDF